LLLIVPAYALYREEGCARHGGTIPEWGSLLFLSETEPGELVGPVSNALPDSLGRDRCVLRVATVVGESGYLAIFTDVQGGSPRLKPWEESDKVKRSVHKM
jgi:hypothetical protein